MRRPRAPRAVLSLCIVLTLLGCPPKRIEADEGLKNIEEPTQPKFEAKKSSDADDALNKANHQAEQGKKKDALESYLAVRKAYPDTTAGQDALYRAGVLYYEQGDYQNARSSLNELLFENPLFPQANDARLKSGLSALELGAYRDAYQTLNSLAQRTQGAEQEQAMRAAERAAAQGQLFSEALRIAVERIDEARTPEEKQQALNQVETLIEGQVPFVEIVRVQHDLSPSHPAWPLLTFKLARIYYHLRDWNRLNETLEAFLKEAPNHPFAPEAKQMWSRAQRRSDVHAKRVGVILPMSGKFKPFGDAVLRGIQLSLEGSDVELVVKDSKGDVMVAGKAVEELVFDDGAIAIIGPLLAEDSQRAALVAEELQMPILTLTRQEGITQLGSWVFRNMLTNSAQAEALARYATQTLGYKNFGVLYPNVGYGVELANDFWNEVEKRGGTMRGAESYEHDQTTFTNEAKKLVGRYYLEDRSDYLEGVREIQGSGQDSFRKRKSMEKLRSQLQPVVDFDALFVPDDWRRVSLVAPALAVEDIITNACDPRDLEKIRKTTGRPDLKTVTLLGANQWSSPKGRSGMPELLERGGKFVTCSVYVDGFFADSERPGTKKFVKLWRSANKDRDPTLLEASGYDAGGMVRKVIEQSKPTSRAAFRENLADLKDFDGATGKTSFDDRREGVKQLFLLSIDSKGVKEIDPNAKVTGS